MDGNDTFMSLAIMSDTYFNIMNNMILRVRLIPDPDPVKGVLILKKDDKK